MDGWSAILNDARLIDLSVTPNHVVYLSDDYSLTDANTAHVRFGKYINLG
jgi:hypothetical protein